MSPRRTSGRGGGAVAASPEPAPSTPRRRAGGKRGASSASRLHARPWIAGAVRDVAVGTANDNDDKQKLRSEGEQLAGVRAKCTFMVGVLLGGIVCMAIAVSASAGTTQFLRSNGVMTADTSASSTVDDRPLQLALLMSFPNSGTSYTSQLVRTATRQKTASNYRSEDAGSAVAVFPDSPSGPFWSEWGDKETAPGLPTGGFLLTKTHCGGYCVDCLPVNYLKTSQSFAQHCLEGGRVEDDNGNARVDSYSKDLVARAVHLIRDPFDNIVSRFHLARKNFEKYAVYPSTREGFRDFCASLGEQFRKEEQSHGDIFDEAALAIPCHADFFRYIQWHNLAFLAVSDHLEIPLTRVLLYEDYTHSPREAQGALLDFLELERDAAAEPAPFLKGKTYRHYFTTAEIAAVKELFSKHASSQTLEYTRHYFQ
ncbi:hypothetical protein ACHAXT_005107 [Thalassiosira profunda]